MRKLILIFSAALLLACGGRKYTYVVYDASEYKKSVSDRKFTAGNDFQLYVHNTHKVTQNGITQISHQYPDTSKNIIDQVFLLLSREKNIAAYFTYRPDKYMTMLSKLDLRDTAINFFYLRSIQFGKIEEDGSKLVFLDKKYELNGKKDEWQIVQGKNSLGSEIIRPYAIDEYARESYQNTISVGKSSGHQMVFEKVQNYELIYQEPLNEEETTILNTSNIMTDTKMQKRVAVINKWKSYRVLENRSLYLSKNGKNMMMIFKGGGDTSKIHLSYRKSRLLYAYDEYFSPKK